MRYGCSSRSSKQTMLLFWSQQEICQESGISNLWIWAQQNRALPKTDLLTLRNQRDIARWCLTRINQVASLWLRAFVSQLINMTRHPMHFLKNKPPISYIWRSNQWVTNTLIWRCRMRAISNENACIFKLHAMLLHIRPRDTWYLTCGKERASPFQARPPRLRVSA